MIYEFAKCDTAVKSILLEKYVTKTWSEFPNVKTFKPRIKKKDLTRLNELLTYQIKF